MAQYNKNTYKYLDNNKTLFEVMMIADQYGNMVGPSNPSGVAVDAFGRARSSDPVTLFESANRYQDNGKFYTDVNGTANAIFNSDTSAIDMTVGSSNGDSVIRESSKVFSYQPGKSLFILNTFVLPNKSNVRTRVGYFDTENGVFLEKTGTGLPRFVLRSSSSGSLVDNGISQTSWNVDPLDGSGPSGLTLDITKAHIFWTDIEWLGVGSVRCGFVINGQLVHCHTFHHANSVNTTYMTTACLPIRYEITNTDNTSSETTLQQICSTVISEGGYQLTGSPRAIGTGITNAQIKDIPTAGTYVPVIAIRLKSGYEGSIVIPRDISLIGIGNNTRIAWRVYNGSGVALTGANTTFVSAATESPVEYCTTATGFTGGEVLSEGYTSITNQSVGTVSLADGKFTYQLTRNTFTGDRDIFLIAATGAANGDDVAASVIWEEVN